MGKRIVLKLPKAHEPDPEVLPLPEEADPIWHVLLASLADLSGAELKVLLLIYMQTRLQEKVNRQLQNRFFTELGGRHLTKPDYVINAINGLLEKDLIGKFMTPQDRVIHRYTVKGV